MQLQPDNSPVELRIRPQWVNFKVQDGLKTPYMPCITTNKASSSGIGCQLVNVALFSHRSPGKASACLYSRGRGQIHIRWRTRSTLRFAAVTGRPCG